jgi:hypothetical protein
MCYDDLQLRKSRQHMEKICTKCRAVLPLSLFSKDKYKPTGYRSACKPCSAKEFSSYLKTQCYRDRLEKYKQQRQRAKAESPIVSWASCAFYAAKQRAKKSGLEFSITKDWIVSNAVEVCPLLGLTLDYGAKKSHDSCASLDRRDSSLGYTPENCKVVSFRANRIKNNATIEEMERLVVALRTY